MNLEMYDRNMAMFQLYEKGKYISILTNKIYRKDIHYGFSQWR